MPKQILLGVGLAVGVTAVEARPADPIPMLPGSKHLFLDDHAVEEMQGLDRTMHPPEKRGAVLRPDVPSDGCRLQTYSSPALWVPEENMYKFVYMAFPMENHNEIGAALAVSSDGVHWEKPDLGQGVSVRGSTRNNRIFVDRALKWGDNSLMNVIFDPDDPDPARRYKGMMGSIGRCPVVSSNCVQWRKLDIPPVPSQDTSTLTLDAARGRYLAMVKTFNKYGRAAALSISEDFEQWTDPVLNFGADAEDQARAPEIIRERLADPGLARPLFVDPDPATGWVPPAGEVNQPTWRAECYSFSVFPYEGLYIGLAMMYYPTGTELPARNNTDGFDCIQLAMSRDLTQWERLGDRADFLPPSRIDNGLIGVFDRQQMTAPGKPLRVGDELWFYYTGFKTRIPMYSRNADGSPRKPATLTPEEQADLDDGWSAICLAALRVDGFVSLDAGSPEGTILTRRLVAAGSNLYLNLDAGGGGSARVEVLDETGRPVPGFARGDCVPLTGGGVRQPVQWDAGSEWTHLRGQTLRLKIYLTRARLYAFWGED